MNASITEAVWSAKYRFAPAGGTAEADIAATRARVASAVAAAETDASRWERCFAEALEGFVFLPGGRVLAGAGTGRQVTLFNCFVSGPLTDCIEGILDTLKETAVTMQQGGGIGINFSPLRPAGCPAVRTGGVAGGPLPFMHIWNALCETLLATSSRRGAMMGTLRCDHPDVLAFIDAKRDDKVLNNFNLSVLITDAFMQAVAADDNWALVYPDVDGRVYRRLPAREIWQRLVQAAHETAEPGVLFVDTINRDNNLYYCEEISATNPCGEVPLPPYGACDLGSINLATLVENPFSDNAYFDDDRLRAAAATAVRFLDDAIDVSRYPLVQQAEKAYETRRIGLGITGLADALAMLGLRYDSDAGRDFAARAMTMVRDAAYSTSISLAEEKGCFPAYEREAYLAAPFIRRLRPALRDGIAAHGIRNSHLLAIAPTGTISLLAGNVSSGIEPIYALEAERSVRMNDGDVREFNVRDFAYDVWLQHEDRATESNAALVTANALPAGAHLAMQARLQPLVDGAISKTVNLPGGATVDDVAAVFTDAHGAGIKGCTVFRTGSRCGQVLRARDDAHCCRADYPR